MPGALLPLPGSTTDGRARTDLDPVQLRWAGVPRSRAFDAIDIRPGQREFLNVLVLRPVPRGGWSPSRTLTVTPAPLGPDP